MGYWQCSRRGANSHCADQQSKTDWGRLGNAHPLPGATVTPIPVAHVQVPGLALRPRKRAAPQQLARQPLGVPANRRVGWGVICDLSVAAPCFGMVVARRAPAGRLSRHPTCPCHPPRRRRGTAGQARFGRPPRPPPRQTRSARAAVCGRRRRRRIGGGRIGGGCGAGCSVWRGGQQRLRTCSTQRMAWARHALEAHACGGGTQRAPGSARRAAGARAAVGVGRAARSVGRNRQIRVTGMTAASRPQVLRKSEPAGVWGDHAS